ncbi:hypothetical protein AB0D59_49850 [Streptomyces sp. NPDC048417]|uniref:hypothetical protein n=1 Tax=Streptomyces sp. NPDC048417 TaxID=3155387 RepID=UPI003440B746
MAAGALRTVPLAGELTASLIHRAAGVLRLWTCRNSLARHESGGVRADAEVVLNEAGRGVLAELCGMGLEALARALLGFTVDDRKISTGPEVGAPQARWRAAGTVAGPAAFGCRLCTARRTGEAVRAVRYLPYWRRVCLRHGQPATSWEPFWADYDQVRRLDTPSPDLVATPPGLMTTLVLASAAQVNAALRTRDDNSRPAHVRRPPDVVNRPGLMMTTGRTDLVGARSILLRTLLG